MAEIGGLCKQVGVKVDHDTALALHAAEVAIQAAIPYGPGNGRLGWRLGPQRHIDRNLLRCRRCPMPSLTAHALPQQWRTLARAKQRQIQFSPRHSAEPLGYFEGCGATLPCAIFVHSSCSSCSSSAALSSAFSAASSLSFAATQAFHRRLNVSISSSSSGLAPFPFFRRAIKGPLSVVVHRMSFAPRGPLPIMLLRLHCPPHLDQPQHKHAGALQRRHPLNLQG